MRALIPFALLISTVLAQLWMLRPLEDADLYTYIVVGRWLPFRATLTEAELNTPAFLAWLASWTYAQVDSWAGLVGVQALHIFLLIVSFTCLCIWQGMVMCRINRDTPSLLALGGGMAGAYLVSATNADARTQDFTYFCFSLLLLLLEHWSRPTEKRGVTMPRTVALFFLLVFWQNAHATVLLSIPIIAAYVIWRRLPLLYLLLPPIASICTVNGYHIFSWTATNVAISRDMLGISEWLHPWHPAVQKPMLPFWFFASALLLAGCNSKTRRWLRDPSTATLSLVFFVLTLTSARFAALWGFVSAPLFGQMLAAVWPGMLATVRLRSTQAPWYWLLAALSAILLAKSPGRLLPANSPLPLFQSLKAEHPNATIFNYREYGGALEYVGYPEWRVYIDGRILLFAPETWRTYEAVANATDRLLVDEVVRTHDLLVLHPSYHRALIAALKTHSGARLINDDENVVVFSTFKR